MEDLQKFIVLYAILGLGNPRGLCVLIADSFRVNKNHGKKSKNRNDGLYLAQDTPYVESGNDLGMIMINPGNYIT